VTQVPDRCITVPGEEKLPAIPGVIVSDFLPYMEAEPFVSWIRKIHWDANEVLPTVEFPLKTNWEQDFDVGKKVIMVWIEKRGEWVALQYHEWQGSGAWKDDKYQGPYELDIYCQNKLLDAYGVPKDTSVLRNYLGGDIGSSQISPEQLGRIGKLEQAQTFSVFFDVGNDEDTYSADWDWQTPGWGISSRDYGLGHAWRFMGGIKDKSLGDEVRQSAYLGLLGQFGISPESLTLEQFAQMSPRELAKLGTKDPKSYTLGDRRRASEVKGLSSGINR
jgi:hypothetical protein